MRIVQALKPSVKMASEEILEKFDTMFNAAISAALDDLEVVAFKSIACYRTGLDISPADPLSSIISALEDAVATIERHGTIRLASKAFNDHFVRLTLRVATKPGAWTRPWDTSQS